MAAGCISSIATSVPSAAVLPEVGVSYDTLEYLLQRAATLRSGHIALGPDCSYSVALPPGDYRVELDRRGIDRSMDLPRVVTITDGQTTRLDISIDTGIR